MLYPCAEAECSLFVALGYFDTEDLARSTTMISKD